METRSKKNSKRAKPSKSRRKPTHREERIRSEPGAQARVTSTEPFSTLAGDARDTAGNRAHTDGLRGTKTTYDDGSIFIEATEEVLAFYDGTNYGPRRALQTRAKRGNTTVVHHENYTWRPRVLPDATLLEDHPGLDGAADHTGRATRFGKNDTQDSGASSPTYKIVQTCSEVFGVAIKAQMMRNLLGRNWATDPRRLTAIVEVYRQTNRRLARVPIVEVGPGSPDALIDLTWALDQFLGTNGGAEVNFRIIV